ncbi:inorganic phosphate transporter [Aeromicrobium sp. Root495]|uniref:inorganic phosphate transporter n=1 Tax=Aeromicrobium sp. Root495 TaxID=1736550 RepID=UPI0006F9E07C|nr:inorganic phosphate transporter [Aeromicrobium sp. Root495]KQY58371.1 inorganic phosphate transporter [Aeromicrobium sp. Root495]RYJ06106.1 MAG: inorganic phosphate transporter [Actinomycetales bacterium]
MDLVLALVIITVGIALFFDYTNGFHDAANAIATSVSTRALTPRIALTMAAILNFVGALLGVEVAKTIKDILKGFDAVAAPEHALTIVLSALVGAITWNLITWYFGIPSSSSHALIGGLIGVGLAAGVTVDWDKVIDKVAIPMILSPTIGFCGAFVAMTSIMWIFRRRNPHQINRGFRFAQVLSAAALSLGHGLQDAQKTMGVIVLALIAGGEHTAANDDIPLWVVIAAASAISLGTMSGGMRIMRTMGRRIIAVDPPRGFAAESTAAVVLYGMAIYAHAPVSTTHTMTSAVMGAGATKRFSAVRWGVARGIIMAWIITIPAAASVGAITYFVLRVVIPGN